MSRYPPPGEQRFVPRDRTPPRFQDRRPSAAFNNFQPSGAESRPLNDNAPGPTIRDAPREPPRGPKALENASRPFPPSGPRSGGRGFGGRPEFRDREYYDSRDAASSFRRDGDRDWGRRDREYDNRDSRPMYGRGKSRSPLRDFRDPRDVELGRIRRDSAAGLPPSTEPPIFHGSHPRGLSARGRGRGDWERGRVRGPYIDDRNDLHPRSRSRDRRWEPRDERERDRDPGRERLDRWDDDRRSEYGDRQRPGDRWKEARPPSRTGSLTTPSTPHPPSAGSSLPASVDKPAAKDVYDPTRRISSTPYLGSREGRGEEKPDYFSTHHKPSKEHFAPRVASPSPAPQVPAFGSVNSKVSVGITPGAGPKTPSERPPHAPPLAPSSTTTNSAESNVPAAQHRAEIKNVPTPSVAQAPTGPRADRTEKQPDALPRDVIKPTDGLNRHDIPFRASLPSTGSAAGKPVPVNISSASQIAPNQQNASITDLKQTKSPVLPSSQTRRGSFSSSQPFGRHQPGSATSPGPPPSAPTRPSASATSPRATNSSIPTGPRAQRELMPNAQRSAPRGSMQWISPKAPQYAPRVPSIMNTVPVRRDYRPEDKDRPLSSGKGVGKSPVSEHSPSFERRLMLSPRQAAQRDQGPRTNDSSFGVDHHLKFEDKIGFDQEKQVNLPDSLGQSGDEVGEDEDGDLDEEDFDQAERKFELDMGALKLKKPHSPLKDEAIVDLLLKMQALGVIASGTASDVANDAMEVDKETKEQQAPPGLPSPVIQEGERRSVDDQHPQLTELPSNRPPTPPLSDLPFLSDRPLTPFSDMEDFKETVAAHERNEDAIRQQLINHRDLTSRKHAELRSQYAASYRKWRLVVQKMDKSKRDSRKELTPLPASPPPSVTPAVTPAPLEGRRALKFGSEFDLERVMQESMQTHREEQEKRESEGKARADPRKEAPIPDMRDAHEADSLLFKDLNGLITGDDALRVFRYVPPEDDFSPEEHEVFLKAYVVSPKKFGKIAEALPENRDFRQCIQHYYLTKQQANYKAECNKGTKRKGRRKAPLKPSRANALMSDLRGEYEREDADNPPAVTDTGRPRRAAAPTFGDAAADTDTSGTNGAASMRRGAAKDAGDQPLESRPAVRRLRGGGSARGGKRTKAQQPVAVVPGPSPQRLMVQQLSPQKDDQRQDLEGANLLASLHSGRAEDRVLIPTREIPIPGPAMADMGPSKPPKQQKGWMSTQQTPTSYWSVPEQNDFPKYVAHFGKDYVAIANHMLTKTPIMVKNYFLRNVEQGKWELEEAAQAVEEKKQRGEPMGPPPARTMVAKRRYDATPSSATQRPLAPSVDGMDIDNGSPNLRPTQPQHSPPNIAQPKLHPLALAQAGPAGLNSTAAPGDIRPKIQQQQQRPMQGPRAGFFTDDRKDNSTVQQMSLTHQQSHQQAQPPLGQNQVLMQSADPVHTATWRQAPEPGQKPPRAQQSMQQLAQPLPHQASAGSLRQYLSSHGGNLTVDIVEGHPHTVFKREDDNTALRRIEQYSPHGAREFGAPMQESVLSPLGNPYRSPTKEAPRPSSTPAQMPEIPRPSQAPTKRIAVMSMLNDDTESQPTKRLKEVHDETPKTQSPALAYQPASQPLSRVDSQQHAPAPVQAHAQQYAQPLQHAGLQHQQQAQQGQQPRSAGPYQDLPSRWTSQTQNQRSNADWFQKLDPRPGNRHGAYSPPQTTTNSPPINPACAPPSSVLRHTNHQVYQHNQHAPSPPPLQHPQHPSQYRNSSQQQHARIPSFGHQQSPAVGLQHPSHTGPPPVPAIRTHPYAAPSPPPQAQVQAPPLPQQSRHPSRDYMSTHGYMSSNTNGPHSTPRNSREVELRHQERLNEMVRRQEMGRHQPARTYTPPSAGPSPWGPTYGGDRGGAGGAGSGSGEKREIY